MVDYVIDYKLVRGLDYYNDFVFEWVTDSLGSQSAVCAEVDMTVYFNF